MRGIEEDDNCISTMVVTDDSTADDGTAALIIGSFDSLIGASLRLKSDNGKSTTATRDGTSADGTRRKRMIRNSCGGGSGQIGIGGNSGKSIGDMNILI